MHSSHPPAAMSVPPGRVRPCTPRLAGVLALAGMTGLGAALWLPAQDAGADAVTLANTVMGMVIDVDARRPVLGAGGGGVSGPAIHPVAVRTVYDCYAALPDDEDRAVFQIPPFIRTMVERRILGDKSGGGFYRKAKGGDIETLDPATLEYRPRGGDPEIRKAIKAIEQIDDPAARVRALVEDQGKAGRFAWKVLSRSLAYAARRLGEIADSVVAIDDAMRWGYNWELGPFQTWDALGFEQTLAQEDQEQEPDRWVSGHPPGQEAWQLLSQLGAVTTKLVWDRESAIGGKGRPTEAAAGFVGTLRSRPGFARGALAEWPRLTLGFEHGIARSVPGSQRGEGSDIQRPQRTMAPGIRHRADDPMQVAQGEPKRLSEGRRANPGHSAPRADEPTVPTSAISR